MIQAVTYFRIMCVTVLVVAILICWIRGVNGHRASIRREVTILIVVGMTVIICFGLASFYRPMEKIDRIRMNVAELSDKLRYGTDSTQPEQLQVMVKTPCTLYLRGQVSDYFAGNQWTEYQENLQEKYKGMMNYFASAGFHPQTMVSESVIESGCEYNTVAVTHTGASRKYMYLPNSVILSDEQKESKENLKNPDRVRTNAFRGKSSYAYDFVVPSELSSLALTVPGNRAKETIHCEKIYRSYVYDRNLDVPEDVRQKFDSMDLRNVGGTSQLEVLKSVREFLDIPEKLNTEFSNQYDEVTLDIFLLRYCGIPARYVSGYYVNCATSGVWTTVNREDAHSWTEVYLDGVGFVTFETNPYYENYRAENKSDAAVYTDYSEDTYRKLTTEKEGTDRENRRLSVPWILWFLILLLAVMLLVMYWKWRRKRSPQMKNMAEFTRFLCIRLEKVLKYDNVLVDMNRPYEYRTVIRNQYGDSMYRLFIQFLNYTDEVLFHEAELSPEEQQDMRRIVQVFETNISQKTKPVKRRRYGRIYEKDSVSGSYDGCSDGDIYRM